MRLAALGAFLLQCMALRIKTGRYVIIAFQFMGSEGDGHKHNHYCISQLSALVIILRSSTAEEKGWLQLIALAVLAQDSLAMLICTFSRCYSNNMMV